MGNVLASARVQLESSKAGLVSGDSALNFQFVSAGIVTCLAPGKLLRYVPALSMLVGRAWPFQVMVFIEDGANTNRFVALFVSPLRASVPPSLFAELTR